MPKLTFFFSRYDLDLYMTFTDKVNLFNLTKIKKKKKNFKKFDVVRLIIFLSLTLTFIIKVNLFNLTNMLKFTL